MALKLKYTDERGILHINMSPSSTPKTDDPADPTDPQHDPHDPKFDSINARFTHYDLFGGKYELENGGGQDGGASPAKATDGGGKRSLFSTRYNSVEQELARTPYAFTDRFSIESPSRDIEDDSYFKLECDLFGARESAFTVTQLIHAQDRYFDLSKESAVRSAPAKRVVRISDERAGRDVTAFKVLEGHSRREAVAAAPTSQRKREHSFAILSPSPPRAARPASPRSLPPDGLGRVSPFRGRGFRDNSSRHTSPKTSAANSRANSPPRRRTRSLTRTDKMAAATLPPLHIRPHSPRNFLKENIEEVRELSELNREKHEAEAEMRRAEEEEALLIEMGLLKSSSRGGSKNTSRCNSPSKIKIRSRSNSPAAILRFESIPTDHKALDRIDRKTIDKEVDKKPVQHKSRVRSTSRSQPPSNNGSPKNSKIPKRQNSVSPTRTVNRWESKSNLNKNQRFISNSTSSIHETIKIGSSVHDKRAMSKSSQHLSIAPPVIKGKPPISPGRVGPPPSNRAINPKRLSPIAGTPNKSPIDNAKVANSTPTATLRKTVKATINTGRMNIKQTNGDVTTDKVKLAKTSSMKSLNKPNLSNPTRTPSQRMNQKPSAPSKVEVKKPMNRTDSVKSFTRGASTKNLNGKPPVVKKKESPKDVTENKVSNIEMNGVGDNKENNIVKETKPVDSKQPESVKNEEKPETTSKPAVVNQNGSPEDVVKTDNETQVENSITNDRGDLVIMTKKNIVSMTTAAITAQPLEVVTTVTNQLPAALEKAREKGMFERHSSKDSIALKADPDDLDEIIIEGKKSKPIKEQAPRAPVLIDDNIKLKPLQPPYNNPQVARAKQKIDDILKAPEVSPENILTTAPVIIKDTKTTFKNIADKTKNDLKETKNEITTKFTSIKDQAMKQSDKLTQDIRTEATNIVNSIITPVLEPADPVPVPELKKEIEPIVMVVNEKKTNGSKKDSAKTKETLVRGEPETELESSNVSTPVNKMAEKKKMADGSGSDKSSQSNGGLPQSTSTTPKPPARAHRPAQDRKPSDTPHETPTEPKKPNICQRLLDKCKSSRACTCCVPHKQDGAGLQDGASVQDGAGKQDGAANQDGGQKEGFMSKFSCCKKKEKELQEQLDKEVEKAARKVSIEFENESKPNKRSLRDVVCCGRRRVSDVVGLDGPAVGLDGPAVVSGGQAVVSGVGCCGRRKAAERRDSILSEAPSGCCAALRGRPPRRASLFSKNKSLSPTLPPEDTRPKLDASLVEHTSAMKGAIPVLPVPLAYVCLVCNVLAPGLGTVLSGVFCLCLGIPRFGAHDSAKHRIGSFLVNVLVGCAQLFTLLFCLVGYGWSVWWGVIMVKVAQKYKRLKAEALEAEEPAPPVVTNNHARA